MNLYVTSASGTARLGIYSNNGGEPGTLLAQTSEFALSNGWNSSLLGTSQNLISGATYWLAIEVNSSATTLYYNSVRGRSKYKSFTYGIFPSAAPLNCDTGEAIYSAYADNSNGSSLVTGMKVIMVKGVNITPASSDISVNAAKQLTASVFPSDASNKNVSWSSSNSSVATVNSTGLVTGVAVGSAIITSTVQDGGKTATIVITVSSGEASLGLNTVGSIAEKENRGYWIANSFTAVSNITVSKMNLYVNNASGKARLGIYSSNGSEPGSLLAQTNEISLSTGWNSGTLGTPQNLTPGLTYWLAFEVKSSATTLYYNSAKGRLRYIPFTYGSLPTNAPINCVQGTGIYSLFAY